MDSIDPQNTSSQDNTLRNAGIAFLCASVVLALTLLVLHKQTIPQNAPVAIATSTVPDAFTKVSLQAKSAIVYDLSTGETLYANNAEAQLPLASLTKLLTVYAAFSKLPSNTLITIPADVTKLDAPHAFSAGQTFSLIDLARLTLTASLNDGATAIAEVTASRNNLSQNAMLASAAAALALPQTYALNGSGLDVNKEISGGYGSAHDMAILSGSLLAQAPTVAFATTQSSVKAVSTGGTSFTVKNTDPIITTIPRLLLSKTGYTDLAGGNLALVFDAGINHPIAVIVLGSSEKGRFTDGSTLVSATLAHFANTTSL